MAAGNTYTQIASTTLGSAAASVTFSSIAGTYTDLVLVVNGALNTSTSDLNFRINSDSGSNYSRTTLSGSGSAATSVRASSVANGRFNYEGYLDTTFATVTIGNFQNYSNTTTYKTVLSRGNNAGNGTSAVVNLWRNTAAINAIEIFVSGGPTFVVGSTFNLYGITAA